jgi:predicted nucleic acid-binding protein
VIRTYVDAGVLIAAVRGDPNVARSVFELLEDPEREFVASAFVRLEVLPKAIYQQRAAEIAFYHAYFSRVMAWADTSHELAARAEQEAARFGLSALDALHIAAALALAADQLVTTEGPRKPIHRAEGVRIVAI